jgi:hypothetical protein
MEILIKVLWNISNGYISLFSLINGFQKNNYIYIYIYIILIISLFTIWEFLFCGKFFIWERIGKENAHVARVGKCQLDE